MRKSTPTLIIFLFFLSISTHGFSFPQIPMEHWVLDNLHHYSETSQYISGGWRDMTVSEIYGGQSVSFSGYSYEHSIHIRDVYSTWKYPCNGQINPRFGPAEHAHPETYSNGHGEIMYFNFAEGRLIIFVGQRNKKNKPKFARYTWQTYEMMDASYQ